MNIQYTHKEEQIFQSALSIILDKGFHGTPMSQIAKASQVSIGTIYHYFESKDDLILQLFSYSKNKVSAFITDSVFDDPITKENYEEKFMIFWRRFISFYLKHPSIFSFLEQFYASPYYEMYQKKYCASNYSEDTINRFLNEGLSLNAIRKMSSHILYTFCLGSVIFLIRNSIYGQKKHTENQINQLIQTIWNGVKI